MTALDEYRLHTTARSATIDRCGISWRRTHDTHHMRGLAGPESVERIGLDVIKSIHVREEVDESRVDVYRGRPQLLAKTLTISKRGPKSSTH